MTEINIDGTNCILGRIGTYVAKKALLGNTINIFNCEKVVISGDPRNTKAKYKHHLSEKGQPHKGPYVPRMPDRFVKRAIRGMFAYKNPRGKEAFKKVTCYISVPTKFKDAKLEEVKGSNSNKLLKLKKCTVLDVCRHLGGKL